jgi:hypothetical protein
MTDSRRDFEEVHASPLWAALIAAPAIVAVVVAASTSVVALRIIMAITAVITFGAVALAWSGFRYVFTNSGLEIRTLGFTLRSIPAGEIREYRVDKWDVAGGYGIRGLGANRAYVWGNRGVRIMTGEGQVFLGSSNPERMVHELDQMKRVAHS